MSTFREVFGRLSEHMTGDSLRDDSLGEMSIVLDNDSEHYCINLDNVSDNQTGERRASRSISIQVGGVRDLFNSISDTYKEA